MTPRDRGWGAPGLNRDQLERIAVPLEPVPMLLRREVAPVFRELVRWLDAERQRLGRPRLSSSGGYVFRPVRGYESRWQSTRADRYLSNHSWGTAADFNAGTNPMQSALRTDMPPGTNEKARSLGLSWGGVWAGRKDPMHFEVVVSPTALARITAGLGGVSAQAEPAPPPVLFDAEPLVASLPVLEMPEGYPGVQNEHPHVRTAQGLLVAAASVGLTDFRGDAVDGSYGPGTKAAVLKYQSRLGLDADGVIGPKTWRALLALPAEPGQ